MKKNNSGWKFVTGILFAVCFLSFIVIIYGCAAKKTEKKFEHVKVTRGNLVASIPSTGVVTPRNRLEIKPPVSGRVEQVLVEEGDRVTKGQMLAWISSSDRAALLDAARAQGPEQVKYWEDVYKPAPILAPIDGFIILRNVQPGQTFNMSDAVLVMADKLIIKAQVDETDIGKIKIGQKATIVLDAYPDKKTDAVVESIEYESQVINNVTIYVVNVVPAEVPDYFRSGMSATVNFDAEGRDNVLLLPLRAVKKTGNQSYVFVNGTDNPLKAVQVVTGLDNNDMIEIVSGAAEGDEVIIPDAATAADLMSRRGGPGGLFSPFGGRRR